MVTDTFSIVFPSIDFFHFMTFEINLSLCYSIFKNSFVMFDFFLLQLIKPIMINTLFMNFLEIYDRNALFTPSQDFY